MITRKYKKHALICLLMKNTNKSGNIKNMQNLESSPPGKEGCHAVTGWSQALLLFLGGVPPSRCFGTFGIAGLPNFI
jgi:hypothetical protein